MQNFYTALKDAGNVIETSFITNLKTITPKLQELTTAVADTIAHFLNSKEFAIWMDKASNAIQHFVEYLTSPQAIKDFDRFVTGISNVATGLENLAKLLGFFPKTKEEEVEENQKNAITLGGSITPGTILKSGAQAIGETSQTLVSKNPLDYPLSTLKSVTDFLTTPLLSLDKVKNFFNNSKGLSLEQKNKEKAKDFIKGSKLEGVDPKLAASIQSAGFTVESGKRTLKEENDLIAGYDSKGNPITATGRPVGGAKSHHIPGEAVDVTMDSLKRILAQYTEQELKDKFNLYSPLGKRDPNHLELWDRNRTDIYVNNPAGSGLILTTASQAGTQGTAN